MEHNRNTPFISVLVEKAPVIGIKYAKLLLI